MKVMVDDGNGCERLIVSKRVLGIAPPHLLGWICASSRIYSSDSNLNTGTGLEEIRQNFDSAPRPIGKEISLILLSSRVTSTGWEGVARIMWSHHCSTQFRHGTTSDQEVGPFYIKNDVVVGV